MIAGAPPTCNVLTCTLGLMQICFGRCKAGRGFTCSFLSGHKVRLGACHCILPFIVGITHQNALLALALDQSLRPPNSNAICLLLSPSSSCVQEGCQTMAALTCLLPNFATILHHKLIWSHFSSCASTCCSLVYAEPP